MAIDIKIDDQATPALKDLLLRVSGRRGHAVIGQAVRVLVRSHLRDKEAQPNKQGWPKTHYYSRARERVTFEATDTSATVTIAMEGFRQRYRGGPILPVNRKALTIPATPEAYGKVAREFGRLEFRPAFGAKMIGFLVAPAGSALAGTVLFRLVRSVMQKPDPSVVPTPAQIIDASVTALSRVVTSR